MTAITYPMLGRSGSNRGGKPSDLSRDIPYDHRRMVGAYLQAARLKAGMTQEEVGRLLGNGGSSISAVELGRTAVSPERYGALADILGMSRKVWGEFLLKHYNPWLYDLIFPGDPEVEALISALPERTKPMPTEERQGRD